MRLGSHLGLRLKGFVYIRGIIIPSRLDLINFHTAVSYTHINYIVLLVLLVYTSLVLSRVENTIPRSETYKARSIYYYITDLYINT